MYCTKCGTMLTSGAAYCQACGEIVQTIEPATTVISVEQPIGQFKAAETTAPWPVPEPRARYAGFWRRVLPFVIDSVVLSLAMSLILTVDLAALHFDIAHPAPLKYPKGTNVLYSLAVFQQTWQWRPESGGFTGPVLTAIVAGMIACLLIAWLYYAWMESSPSQGTLGKALLGLAVTDVHGATISFGRASARFFARFITNLVPFFLGYLMAGFTRRKQALHDLIAGCLVVRKP